MLFMTIRILNSPGDPQPLWLLTFFVTFLLVFLIWSPPFMYDTIPGWYQSWQKAFMSLMCHQQVARSIQIRDVPLAACSRCTGIFTALFASFAVSTLLLPIFSSFQILVKRYIIKIFWFGLLINLLDGMANLFQLWQTSNVARLLFGLFWGLSLGILLTATLHTHCKSKKNIEKNYGTHPK